MLLSLIHVAIRGDAYALPDGAIFYSNNGADTITLRQMKADGSGNLPVVVNLPDPQLPAWSWNGRLVALTSKGPDNPYSITLNAFVFNPRTGAIQQITHWADEVTSTYSNFTWVNSKAFSSDGARLAVVSMNHPTGVYPSGLSQFVPIPEVYDLQGNRLARLGAGYDGTMHQGDGLDWAPNQELLILPWLRNQSGSITTPLMAVIPEDDALSHADKHRWLTNPIYGYYVGYYGLGVAYEQDFQPAVAPITNRVAYVRERTYNDGGHPMPSEIWVRMVNLDGADDHLVYTLPEGQYVSRLSWAPDESKLILSYGTQVVTNGFPMPSADPATVRLAMMNPDGSGLQDITGTGCESPTWNPQGYTRLPGGVDNILNMLLGD